MAEREIEESKMLMDKLRKRYLSAQFLLQAQEENLRADNEMIQGFKTSFANFLKENIDKKTGRVMLDKFSRYLDDELQSKERDLRKIKLKTSGFETELRRMKQRQQHKMRLSDSLHPVDLDKLQIENQQTFLLLEGKTNRLMSLKKLMGKKGQDIVSMKFRTDNTECWLNSLERKLEQKEAKHIYTEIKETQNLNGLMTAELTKEVMKQIFKTYESPDIVSYIEMENKISDLKKEKEVWERRLHSTEHTAHLLEHQLRLASQISRQSFRSTKSTTGTPKSSLSLKSTPTYKLVRKKTPYPHCTPTSPM